MSDRDHKLKVLRVKYSGWIPQHEIDKLDGISPHAAKATEAIATRFAPEPVQADLEEAVAIKKRKLKVVEPSE